MTASMTTPLAPGIAGTERRIPMKKSRIAYSALALATVLGLTACGAGPNGADPAADPTRDVSDGLTINGELIADAALMAAAAGGTVVMYTGASPESEQAVLDQFTAETGIGGEMTRMAPNKLSERVISENAVDKLSAEIIRTADKMMAAEFVEQGVFVPYETPFQQNLASVEGIVQEGNGYITHAYGTYGIAYNTQLVDQADAPGSWAELADGTWKDKFGLVYAGSGGGNTSLAAFQIRNFGEEYLADLDALEPRIFDSMSTQLDALARGEIEVTQVSFQGAFASKLAGAPIEVVVPDEGLNGVAYGMGITPAGLDNPAAQVFYNWTMSQAGQTLLAEQSYAPARTDLGIESAGADEMQVYEGTDSTDLGLAAVDTWKRIFSYAG
ncbi:extracellular solute-binding protein [Cryobacterium frigoriphilum]|uniref:Extracellular solute-binding protein n=2 Tax=Cryobacterium frigoriphilum TaxID=1259150 RepID=A0A4R9A8M9_9MICO|nr:extracellular solute-binding protein [Cryobacterium frigoriphilum]